MSEPARPSYGDVTAEYFALRDGAGIVAGSVDAVWVRGPDAVRFLDGLLSADIAAMVPGTTGRSLLLGPQGKLRAALWVLRGADEVGLIADAGRGGVVVADLSRFKIRVDVVIEPDDRPTFEVWGPGAGAVAAAAGAPAAGWATLSGGAVVANLGFLRATLPRLVTIGLEAGSLTAAGAVPVGSLAATAVRIEMGEPVTGVDVDESTIPQEAGLVDGAVSFTKGCYLGQELVARIDSRGHVNRLLRGLLLRDALLPPVGAEVRASDRVVGTLTSVAESLRLRAPVALALLRREVQPEDEVAIVWEGGSVAATVADLPLDADHAMDLTWSSQSSNIPDR